MKKSSFVVGIALAAMTAVAPPARTQTPYIAVYFDPAFSSMATECQGQGVLDVWHIAAVGLNTLVTGAEFAVEYPPAVLWVGDLNTPPITINNTSVGISMGYAVPLNGFAPVELCQVQVLWLCDTCAPPYQWNMVNVRPHPATGFLGWTDATYTEHPAIGWTSAICVGTPVEQTTWGHVKALFGD